MLRHARSGQIYPNAEGRRLIDEPQKRGALTALMDQAEVTLEAIEREINGESFVGIPLLDEAERCEAILAVAGSLQRVPIVMQDLLSGMRRLSTMLHVLPNAVLTARVNGRFDYANRRWYEKTAAGSERPIDESIQHAVAPEDRGSFRLEWTTGVARGEPFNFRFRLTTREGWRWHEARATPWLSHGHRIKWVVSLIDVHETVLAQEASRRSERTLRLSAEAGRVLADRAEPRDMAQRLAALVGRELDAACLVEFPDPESRRIVSVSFGSANFGNIRDRVAQNGAACTLERPHAVQPDARSVVGIPLRVPGFEDSGLPDGIAILARVAPQPPLTRAEHAVFEDLVLRTAAALGQRLIARRNRQTAERLQRAMLPVALPDVPGIHLDAAYEAAGHEALVGGDWYDAFVLRDGSLAIAIGDVAGHGIDAAIVMSRLRQSMRVAAVEYREPSLVLRIANTTSNLDPAPIATTFFGIFDPGTLQMRYANAGHPPPLLVSAGGNIQRLPATAPPLGSQEDLDCDTATVSLPSSGALVLYTDALIEGGRDILSGERRLDESIAAWARGGFRESAEQVQKGLLPERPPPDDAAILLLRLHAVGELNLTFAATPQDAHRARLAVEQFVERSAVDKDRAFDFVVALGEALANSVRHAYNGSHGVVRISVLREPAGLRGIVADKGRWREPSHDSDEGGRGLVMMRALCDSVAIQGSDAGTNVVLFAGTQQSGAATTSRAALHVANRQ
ncbi:MAG: SpoIIE family protein phosphatase [Candidatus Eremiobacteraeota bacterium]|nr:SpoIIE family protein phosphatase [Candidatus Eremiobacteraeota bacterium]